MPVGIPDRSDYGDPSFSKINAGQLVDWIVQRHQAARAGLHTDIRLGTPDTGLYSWAARKGLPLPGKKHLAVQQPLHSHEYGKFEGTIAEGYGKGEVKKEDDGKVLITKIEPNKIHFSLAHKRYPERFVLFRPEGGLGGNDKNWLLMNTTPVNPLSYEKQHYKSIPADKIEPLLETLQPNASVQAKIDGSLTLTHLLKDKIELLSHRTSKVHGGPLPHTEKVFRTLPEVTIPKKYQGSVLAGELYGTKDNKPLDPQALGGLLNSSIAKSLQDQDSRNVKLRTMLFDAAHVGKHETDNRQVPYSSRLNSIRDILSSLRGRDADLVRQIYHTPEEAKTPDEAKALYKQITSGEHPGTSEGIVIHPEYGTPMKSKLFNEHDADLRNMFPGKGKYQDKGVGGFLYSHDPDSQIVGEVGTGLSDELRHAMFQNPNDYIGKRMRVRATRKLPSGALFQPSLIGEHLG